MTETVIKTAHNSVPWLTNKNITPTASRLVTVGYRMRKLASVFWAEFS